MGSVTWSLQRSQERRGRGGRTEAARRAPAIALDAPSACARNTDRKLLRECTRSKRSQQNNLLLLPAPVVCCQCESGDQQISRTVAGTDFPARPSCHRAQGLPPGCFGKIPRRPKTELRHQRRKTWGCWTCRRDKFLSVYEA